MTTQNGNINSAMIAIMQDIEAIGKTRKNEAQGFNFRGIEDVMNELHPVFSAHGVICIPMVEKAEHRDAGLTKAGAIITRAIITMAYRFTCTDGSTMEARTIGESIDSADKATAKAMSMALKSLLTGTFLIPTADIVDADYYAPTVDAREELALKNRDKKAMEAIMQKHLSDAEEADGERKKTLLGLAAEMRCKLAELDAQPERVMPPETKPLEATPVEVIPPEKSARRSKPTTAPAAAVVEPETTQRWQDVICHLGEEGGKVKGKTLGDIFSTKSEKIMLGLVEWFSKNTPSDDPKGPALLKAVVEAKAAWKPASAPATTESTKPAEKAPEAPQQPASASDWREFVIPGKNPDYAGKKLGDFDAEGIKGINDSYLPLITWETATTEQKKLKANVALALAELLPPAATLEGEHTKELRTRILASSLNRNDFLKVCISNGYIQEDAKRIEDISAEDAAQLFAGWEILAKEVKAAQP